MTGYPMDTAPADTAMKSLRKGEAKENTKNMQSGYTSIPPKQFTKARYMAAANQKQVTINAAQTRVQKAEEDYKVTREAAQAAEIRDCRRFHSFTRNVSWPFEWPSGPVVEYWGIRLARVEKWKTLRRLREVDESLGEIRKTA